MTSKQAAPQARHENTIVVYGAVLGERPRAALFKTDQKATAEKIASALDFKVALTNLNGLAAKLPPARPAAAGKNAIPSVKPTVYAELLAQLGQVSPTTANMVDTFRVDPKLPEGFPLAPNWDDIKPGMLVIARERPVDGWWEAVVLRVDTDILTLRFRDYLRAPVFTKHRTEVALRKPNK
jgi:hypothetical protein